MSTLDIFRRRVDPPSRFCCDGKCGSDEHACPQFPLAEDPEAPKPNDAWVWPVITVISLAPWLALVHCWCSR